MKRYQFNPYTLSYEEKDVPKAARVVRIVVSVAAACGLVVFYHWFWTSVLDLELPKTAILRMENARWTSKIDVVSRQLEFDETILNGIEERDDHVYRSIFGLDTLSLAGPRTDSLEGRLFSLQSRLVARSESLDSISVLARNAGDMMSHVPAIPPILPRKGSFRLSSPFGHRDDPVHGSQAFHDGWDLATKPGTPIYVTADGTVETARFQFNGYGNEVVVNHGFGFKTRYAHMRLISVTEGMKIVRGDCIGTVGNSGKSTGPHLHYEVLYKERPVNPANYLDMDISVEDYKLMIEERRSASEGITHRSGTSELLRRRK